MITRSSAVLTRLRCVILGLRCIVLRFCRIILWNGIVLSRLRRTGSIFSLSPIRNLQIYHLYIRSVILHGNDSHITVVAAILAVIAPVIDLKEQINHTVPVNRLLHIAFIPVNLRQFKLRHLIDMLLRQRSIFKLVSTAAGRQTD